MNPRATGAAATAAILVIASIYYIAPSVEEPPIDVIRFYAHFVAGAVDETQPQITGRPHLWASPPQWFWPVDRALYDCIPWARSSEVDETGWPLVVGESPIRWSAKHSRPPTAAENARPIMRCIFDIPIEWGCAEVNLHLAASWFDPTIELVETPWGDYRPLAQAFITDESSPPLLVGVCPDPPLPVIEVPEPRFRNLILIGILALLLAGKMRHSSNR